MSAVSIVIFISYYKEGVGFMYQKRWFQSLIVMMLVLVIFLLLRETQYLFQPIYTYIGAIALPFIIGGLLYYISRPIMHLLESYRVPRIGAILIIFVLFILLIYLVVTYIAPIAQEQFTRFIKSTEDWSVEIQSIIKSWQNNQVIIPEQFSDPLKNTTESLMDYAESFAVGLPNFVFNFVAQIVQFIFLIVLVPFFLFYMLKDGEKLQPFVTQFFKEKRATSLIRLLNRMDHTLSAFIQGQLIVSLCVGVLLYIGYVIIGLPYSLSLALFGMLTNVIPFAGPYLAVVPAILVAFFQDPMMVLYVIIIMIIAQQIEGNFISPNIMGKALQIHPLTIITLILAAGSIAGFLGLLFAIPFYAIIKTIVGHFYEEAFHSKEI